MFSFLTFVFAELCFSFQELTEVTLWRETCFGSLVNGEGGFGALQGGGKAMS